MDNPEDLSLAEFVNHPSFRSIASFFLGAVFISCIHFAYRLPAVLAREICARFCARRRSLGGLGLEANRRDEKVHGWLGRTQSDRSSSASSSPESNGIALSLTVCFAMASMAEFSTLLVFTNSAQAGCAFLVAWGGMASQAARLLGLTKLSLDLKKMGVYKWETLAFWSWLVLALVLMFVSNAISTGSLKPIEAMDGSALCFRKHFIATAAASSAVNILLEAYCLIRLHYLLVPAFLSVEHKLDAVLDIRTSRALSLLILDVASVLPAAKFFSVLTDVLPASIGTLIVLVAFNQRSPETSLATTASIPPTRQDSIQSRSTIEIKKMPSAHSLTDRDPRISHPFAARALQDPSPETEDWAVSTSPDIPEKSYYQSPDSVVSPRGATQTKRASNQSGVSESDSDVARSVKGAIVSFAFRDHIAQNRKSRQQRRSFLPNMPSMSELPPHEPPRQTLPRGTPLRIPKPVVPAAVSMEDLERISSEPPERRPASPPPRIALTIETPAITLAQPAPPPPPPPAPSARQSVTVTLPGSFSSDSSKSLHLTPSTPVHSHPSRHASSSSGDWRYDSRHDSLASSHRSSDESSPTRGRRQSGGSARLPPADDDLSVVYEASHEDSESIPPSRVYRPTFGEHMFIQGGLGRPVSPPADVPQDVRTEGNSSGSSKSQSPSNRI